MLIAIIPRESQQPDFMDSGRPNCRNDRRIPANPIFSLRRCIPFHQGIAALIHPFLTHPWQQREPSGSIRQPEF